MRMLGSEQSGGLLDFYCTPQVGEEQGGSGYPRILEIHHTNDAIITCYYLSPGEGADRVTPPERVASSYAQV